MINQKSNNIFLSGLKLNYSRLRNKIVTSEKFQKWVSGVPFFRMLVRKDGEQIYDLMAGFVYSQTLLALIELDVLSSLKSGPKQPSELSEYAEVPLEKMILLCQSAVAINILEKTGSNFFSLSRLGAVIGASPALTELIRHHRLFYNDLSDPVGLLKGTAETQMSRYWPYVLNGKAGDIDQKTMEEYSKLMRVSQKLVAEETLRLVSLSKTNGLLDVGGGTGAFIEETAKMWPHKTYCLFDFPEVVSKASQIFRDKQLKININYVGGDFTSDDFPKGFNTISLIRVLYDHNDEIVFNLLRKVHEALPPGGQLIVSEPMAGKNNPTRYGDAYFGFYTMAMTTGRPRSPKEHEKFLKKIGFINVKIHKGVQQFITRVITAKKRV